MKTMAKVKVRKMRLGGGYTLVGILILVGLASVAGLFSAKNALGARDADKLTVFDRIMYWSGGKRCPIEDNMKLASGLPKCWQAIPQEYALGFINTTKYVGRALRNGGNGTANFYTKDTTLGGAKSKVRFVDFFDGASYMGDLYDLRIYTWRAWGSTANIHLGNGASTVSNWHNGGSETGVVTEWHFYPQNTLKKLDELYYDKDAKNERIVSELDPWDRRVCQWKLNNVCQAYTYYYSESAYRDSAGKIVYDGSYLTSQYGMVEYTAKEMEEYLTTKENSIELLGAGAGAFKGTVAFKDTDSWSLERYVPARGVSAVFTTYNSIESAKREKQHESATYQELCPDATKSDICYYAWGGQKESSPTNRESWMWFNFTSTSEVPFTLIYGGSGHGSGIESSTFTIAHVIKDDFAEMPDSIVEATQEFQADYEKIYGRPLSEDEFFSKHPDVDPDRVVRLFRIYQYSDYDPYTINELLASLDGASQLEWFNCELVNQNCHIPHDPDHNKGVQVMPNGTVITDGYDFVSGDRIYYADMGIPIGIDFENTCYSDNTSIEKVGQDED